MKRLSKKCLIITLICSSLVSCAGEDVSSGGESGDNITDIQNPQVITSPVVTTPSITAADFPVTALPTTELSTTDLSTTDFPTTDLRGNYLYCADNAGENGSIAYIIEFAEPNLYSYLVSDWSESNCTGEVTETGVDRGTYSTVGAISNSEGIQVTLIDFNTTFLLSMELPLSSRTTEYGSLVLNDNVLFLAHGENTQDYSAPSLARRFTRVDFTQPYVLISLEPLPPEPEPELIPNPMTTANEDESFEDRNCTDFNTQPEAQLFFENEGGPSEDPHRLDSDGNGIACEGLS